MRLITRRRLVAATLATGVAAASRRARAEPLVVRLGYASIGAGNRQYVGGDIAATARAGNFVDDAFRNDPNVQIKWLFFAGAGPAVNEAIANEQIDFALQGDLPSVIGRANGLKTKIVMASAVGTPIYLAVPPGSDIKGIKDLKGRTVAMFRGTNLQLAIDKVLAANDITEHDLKVVNMDPPTADAALVNKQIDATFGAWELFGLQRQGLAKIVYTTKGDNPAFGRNSAVLVTEAFDTQHPDITGRVVKAMLQAAAWSSQEANRDQLFQEWAKSGYPPENFRDDFAGQPLKVRNDPLLDPFFMHQYEVQAAMAKQFGLMRHTMEIRGWFEQRYLVAALKDLQLEHVWTPRDAAGKEIGA
ncbi:MAG TPA: ABC transporter substrate-binding protein [Acetobacteraceae bacterium]|jgi:sulfonate transport system substrate-binding protein